MKQALARAFGMAVLCVVPTVVQARPSTVTNSPGYDRRLQESRKELGDVPTHAGERPPMTTAKKSKKKHAN